MQITYFDAPNALNDLVISLPNELRHLLRTQQIFQKKKKLGEKKQKSSLQIEKEIAQSTRTISSLSVICLFSMNKE